MLSSTSIEGTNVVNKQNESLGSIKDLMINTHDGSIGYVVLSFGGFMGMGDKLFAVPWDAFDVDREDERFCLCVDKEKLKEAPGFDKDNWPSSANDTYFSDVNSYYEPYRRTNPINA